MPVLIILSSLPLFFTEYVQGTEGNAKHFTWNISVDLHVTIPLLQRKKLSFREFPQPVI